MSFRFDDRVVVVTGAGNGLGYSHALAYGARGAKVVVNDLGGGTAGGGANAAVAETVANEIRQAGGQAVANTDSVEDGDKIVQCAMDTYGRIDVLINNAGILRDVTFAKMQQDDWDAIYRVHVHGAFRVTHAAWPHMRNSAYGRILMTTSAAGIYGNFGQANYSSAKLALVGMAQALALEGRSKNILVNSIAPTAGSRLTASVLPPALLEVFKPEYVTPLALLLTHESSALTGQLFEVGGGFVTQVRWEQSQGAFFDTLFSAEDLHARWQEVSSFDNSRHFSTITESLADLGSRLGIPLALAPQK